MRKFSQRPIGGMFGLAAVSHRGNAAERGIDHCLMLVNGRSALFALLKLLTPRRIWLPSYLCDAVVLAVRATGCDYRFYPVDAALAVKSAGWLDKIGPGELVVLIDYFGFPLDQEIARRVHDRGAWLVEDASQAYFSKDVGLYADFSIFSPRKFFGVPDGGILRSHCDTPVSALALSPAPAGWAGIALQAAELRSHFDRTGEDGHWFEQFRRVEETAPIGSFEASPITQQLLAAGVDAQAISQRRRENFTVLLNALRPLALFKTLPDGVVPLGFPIRVKNRDALQRALVEQQIYCPIHWRLGDWVPAEFADSHRLSDEILTLVCDQRYDAEDMDRIAALVKQHAQPA